jgi:signal transduction histidine kinase
VYEQDESLRYVWNYGTDLPFSMVGKLHADALPPDEAAALTKLKQQVLDTGEPVYAEIDLSFGGVKKTYREAIEAVRDRTGRPVGVIGAATDLTDEKRVQQELKNAIEVRDRVMGILGHDLRNPLTTMTMTAALLLDRGDLPDDVKRRAAAIERAARRMREMIDTLLDFTRVRSSGQPLPILRQACDLTEVVRDMIDEVRLAYPDRVIELDVQGDARGNYDPSRIAQALSNLVSNAITYGDPAQPIRIGIAGRPDMLTLQVRNEGTPIPDWLRPVLFEPFSRGAPDVISPHGLGLGLFVVREIVSSHGGTIDVVSTLQAGTTFTIHLPRSGQPTQPAP